MRMISRGYVLLTTLVFLQLFTLLGLYALSAVAMRYRFIGEQFQHQLQLAAAERELTKLEKNVPLKCFIPVVPASILAAKSQSWWRSAGCASSDAAFSYNYVIEKLMPNERAVVVNSDNNQCDKPYYYRITLAVIPHAPSCEKVVVQSTVVTKSEDIVPCDAANETVYTGRQMWRHLT